VRKAFDHHYGRGRTLSEEAIRRAREAWGPYQNLAVHYLLAGMRLSGAAVGGTREEALDSDPGQGDPNRPSDVHLVGRYALGVDWTDGHGSIYPFDHLRAACPCGACGDCVGGATDGDLAPGDQEAPTALRVSGPTPTKASCPTRSCAPPVAVPVAPASTDGGSPAATGGLGRHAVDLPGRDGVHGRLHGHARVVASLGGLAIYSWVFSGFLLTSTVTMPSVGRLSDLLRPPAGLPRRAHDLPVGSALSGLAQNMAS
jgi:hypothetical protein